MVGENYEILRHEIMAEDNDFSYMFGEHFEILGHEISKN